MLSASSDTVLVAAPPTLYRQGLLTTLRDTWPALTFTLTTDTQALPRLSRQQPFAFIVLDSALAGASLPGLLAELRVIRHQQPVLVLTGQRLADSRRLHRLGSQAPLLLAHNTPPAAVVATVRPWLSGETGGSAPRRALPSPQHLPGTPLSRRELDVLRLVVNDYCNQEIAQQLSLSVRTVESHRRALLQKTGARTLVGLVMLAVREGWVAA